MGLGSLYGWLDFVGRVHKLAHVVLHHSIVHHFGMQLLLVKEFCLSPRSQGFLVSQEWDLGSPGQDRCRRSLPFVPTRVKSEIFLH